MSQQDVVSVQDLQTLVDNLRGPRGEPGLDGMDGRTGPRGEKGSQGPPGPRGPQGQDGKDGKDGRDGKDGARGETGPAGAPGQCKCKCPSHGGGGHQSHAPPHPTPVCARWIQSNGVPSCMIGKNGDLYIDTSKGDVYQKWDGKWGEPFMSFGSIRNMQVLVTGAGNPNLTAEAGILCLNGQQFNNGVITADTNGAGNRSINLPAVNTVAPGSRITVHRTGTVDSDQVLIQAQAGDEIRGASITRLGAFNLISGNIVTSDTLFGAYSSIVLVAVNDATSPLGEHWAVEGMAFAFN